jgi:hypothetical protein
VGAGLLRGLVVAVLLAGVGVLTPDAARAQAGAPEPEARAVLEVVHTLFDAMREKDEEALRGVFHPEARLVTTGPGPDGVPGARSTPIEGFIQSVVGSPAYLDELLWDEEVRVSGGLATVWTPYAFYADGEFSHCGVDAFQLARTAEGWKIIQVADTRQREGCEIPEDVRPG